MRLTTLFVILWISTIATYAPKLGILTAMKFGIITSLSKSLLARLHHWGWDKYVAPRIAARKARKALAPTLELEAVAFA